MLAIVGFIAASAFLLYVIFGYPALLAVLARTFARPVRTAPCHPSVSLIIAVYNGERFIEQKLRSILQLDYPRELIEIIVASDGSTDRTGEIVAGLFADDVLLLQLPRGGKPAALNAAIARAQNQILVFTDVRQTLAPDSLRLLIENFADPEVGAASAELVLLKGSSREEADVGLYWKYEFWMRLRLSHLDSIFGATGAYYAMRRELVSPMPPTTLLDDMHLPLGAFFRGFRLVVDPRARMFDYPTHMEAEFRRKVRTLAGNYQILRAYPQLLSPRNRMWFHFVSYKFARLLLPFALIALAGFSIALPKPWSWIFGAAQLVFYTAAVLDPWIPERAVWKRLSSPLRAFLTLMLAAFCAVSIFFVPGPKLWRPTEVQARRGLTD
jgi:biofilm PGA synthesis N-glycosyltransferase PgaC